MQSIRNNENSLNQAFKALSGIADKKNLGLDKCPRRPYNSSVKLKLCRKRRKKKMLSMLFVKKTFASWPARFRI
jgi:hypothetical protein